MQKPAPCYQDWDATPRKLGVVLLIIFGGFIPAKAQLLDQDNASVLDLSINGSNKLLVENDTIEFKGIILDGATREPVAYALIKVLDKNGEVGYSNEKGEFAIVIVVSDSTLERIKVSVEYLSSDTVIVDLFTDITKEILIKHNPDSSLKKIVKVELSCSGQESSPEIIIVKPKPFKGFGTEFSK